MIKHKPSIKKIIITGGGTGGHIYPGLAVASALLKVNPNWQVHFVGTQYGLEKDIVPKEIPLHFLPIKGWQNVSFLKKCKVCLLIPFAFLKSIYLLCKIRPCYILGMGGYASGPLMMVGSLMGFHTALWEMNAYPGLTNRILSCFVKECWIVLDSAKAHLKNRNPCYKISIPVRKEIEDLATQKKQNLNKSHHILIFGGSLGAQKINHCIVQWVKKQPECFKNLRVRLQTGKQNYHSTYNELKHFSNIKVLPYLEKIEKDYEWADIVVCRGGASTIFELAAIGKASILIPFSFASEDHQKKNVQALLDQKACVMILERDLNPEKLEKEILGIVNNRILKKTLEDNISKFYKKGAAEKMAERIMTVVG